MPFTTNPYCQLSDVKSALGLQTTQDDTWISGTLIPEAQAYIDREVGYSFQTDGTVPSPASRLYSGTDMDQMYIDNCIQITQVLETNYNLIVGSNGIWQNGTATTMDITADVVLGPDNLPTSTSPAYMVYRLSGNPFFKGRQNYKVSGVFGYPAVPPPISRACIRLASHYYKMRETGYADMLSEQGGVRVHYHKDVPADVMQILKQYRRSVFLAR